jgi:Trk-type K+ transport system membrane component
MIAGAVAFLVYASVVSWVMMHRKHKALWVTISALPIWLCLAVGLLYGWLE